LGKKLNVDDMVATVVATFGFFFWGRSGIEAARALSPRVLDKKHLNEKIS